MPNSLRRLTLLLLLYAFLWGCTPPHFDILIQNGQVFDGSGEAGRSGIEYVLVNGQLAIDQGAFQGIKAGQVLYGPGKK